MPPRQPPSVTPGTYSSLLRRSRRHVRPDDPPEPPRDEIKWLRWWLHCELRDHFGDTAGDKMYSVDLLLDRMSLTQEMKAEAYAVLSNAIGWRDLRDRVRTDTENDPADQLHRYHDIFEQFYLWCHIEWQWASEELLEATRRVIDLLDRDTHAVPPPPEDEDVLLRELGITEGPGQPPKPEVRRGLHALRSLGIGRDTARELLAITGVIAEHHPDTED